MSKQVFIDNNYYLLSDDFTQLRDRGDYRQIREEINRRVNPLRGGIDWQMVHDNCLKMADDCGLDIVMCGYFAVAQFKLHGISGYALGLELLEQYLVAFPSQKRLTAKMRREILDWVNEKVHQELKNVYPSYETLRDLYHCQRLCERLHFYISKQQPDYAVNFEQIAFTLFEHIDQIETQFYAVTKRQNSSKIRHNPKKRTLFLAGCSFLVVLALAASSYWWHEPLPPQVDDLLTHKVARIIPPQDLPGIVKNISPEQLTASQAEIIDLYQQRVEQALAHDFTKRQQVVEQLLAVLQRLYPQHKAVVALQKDVSILQQAGLARGQKKLQSYQDAHQYLESVLSQLEHHKTSSLVSDELRLSSFYQRIDQARQQVQDLEFDASVRLLKGVAKDLKKVERLEHNKRALLKKQLQALQTHEQQLSPLYRRVALIEQAISEKQPSRARQLLKQVKEDINYFLWMTGTLEYRLSHPAKQSLKSDKGR